MKKLGAWFSFSRQIGLVCVMTFLGGILSTLLKQGVCSNIAWILSGFLFVIHPVCPEVWKWKYGDDEKRMKRDYRIAGAAVIFVGLMIRFGV